MSLRRVSPTSRRRFFISSHFPATKYSSESPTVSGCEKCSSRPIFPFILSPPKKANEVELSCGIARRGFQCRRTRSGHDVLHNEGLTMLNEHGSAFLLTVSDPVSFM